MATSTKSCPSCGYTKKDAMIHGDHRLCKNTGNAPWERKHTRNSSEGIMNMSDVSQPKCLLNKSEVERLLSWLRCYPVEGREDERRSLEAILKMSLQLAPLNAL